MLQSYSTDRDQPTTPIYPITAAQVDAWLQSQPPRLQQWVKANEFKAEYADICLLPSETGAVAAVVLGITNLDDFWVYGSLPANLPEGHYRLELGFASPDQWQRSLMAWGLGSYQFDLYRDASLPQSTLLVPENCDWPALESLVSSIYLLRDLVNTPTEDMGPLELSEAAQHVADEFGASIKFIVGDELLKENYPLIHAVGRAANQAPRLIDLRWGDTQHPRVTLVGKGVCYDTGGLSIKNTSGMLLMKKDMAGGAHALALARLIMAQQLPVCLRVLIPAVENSISANSFRPGDVIVARNGISVEITNTDAEGRLVLADALVEACSEDPEIILDFATLTGAARGALGPDLPALFSNTDKQADELLAAGREAHDLMWRLPLYQAYRESYLHSYVADIVNSSSKAHAGAIIAALFLEMFVKPGVAWLHMDIYAFNENTLPGRPQGGDASGLRACFQYLLEKYKL